MSALHPPSAVTMFSAAIFTMKRIASRLHFVSWLTLATFAYAFVITLTAAAQATPDQGSTEDVSPAASPNAKQDAPEPPRFGIRPYRTLVSIGFDRSPEFTPQVRARVRDRLGAVLDRTFGPRWNVEIVEDDGMFPAGATGLERQSAETLIPDPAKFEYDKLYRLAIERTGNELRVSGREWDASTQRLGLLRSMSCAERPRLAETAGRLLGRLFHAQLLVEEIDGNDLSLTLRAGEYAVPDPAAASLAPGEFLIPYLRYLDREGLVRRIQFLPFTYLLVNRVEKEKVSATLVSGLRSPLGSGRRRRVEIGAIVARPYFESTRVRLIPRGNPARPLVAHRITLTRKTLVRDEPIAEPTDVLSDRRGEVEVPYVAEHPLTWVYVWSGEALLARFPIVPGVTESEVAEVPDDSVRLTLEGQLEILQGELIDTVALRSVLLSRMKRHGQKGKWKEYDELNAKLSELRRRSDFDSRLDIIRQNALQAARMQNSRVLESRVRRECAKLRELIGRYLDLEAIRALREEMGELRQLDRSDAN